MAEVTKELEQQVKLDLQGRKDVLLQGLHFQGDRTQDMVETMCLSICCSLKGSRPALEGRS